MDSTILSLDQNFKRQYGLNRIDLQSKFPKKTLRIEPYSLLIKRFSKNNID